MKKLITLILVICLALSVSLHALAAEPVSVYNQDQFTLTLPDGTWYQGLSDGRICFFPNERMSEDDGAILFMVEELNLGGVEVSESLLGSIYDLMRAELEKTAVSGEINQEDSIMAGRPARCFSYVMLSDTGVPVRVVIDCVVVGDYMVTIAYTHPDKKEAELKEAVLAMGASLQYAGDSNAAEAVSEEKPAENTDTAKTVSTEAEPTSLPASASGDAFEIVSVDVTDASDEYWNVRLSVKNHTGVVVHDLILSVCFTDEDGNILETAYPSANVRIKPDKAVSVETVIRKTLNPYMVYVDKVDYYDSNEEYHHAYLDDTEEFPFAVPAENESVVTSPLPETMPPSDTPEPTATPESAAAPELMNVTNGPFVYEMEFGGKKRTGLYIGDKQDGIPAGTGAFVSTDDLPTLEYNGEWKDGQPYGKGFLKDEGFTIHFNSKSQGEYDRSGPFEGTVVNGIPEGEGIFSTVNSEGTKWGYSGTFANGTFNGLGKQAWYDEDETTVIAFQSGNFTDGEYLPSWSQYMACMAESDGYSVFDDSLRFIDEHEEAFTAQMSLKADLIYDNWKLDDFKTDPDKYDQKLISMQNLTVTQVVTDEYLEFDNAFVLLENKDGVMLYGYMAENFQGKAGDTISELYLLPMNWITYKTADDRDVEAIFCAYCRTITVMETPVPTPEPTPEPTPVPYEAPEGSDRSVKIVEEDVTVATGGKKVKLTAEVTALTSDAPAKSVLVWSSSDTSVARVDANGNITGTKPGTVTITVCLKDKPEVKAWTTVTVVRPVKGIKLSEKTLTLSPSDSKTITATITPKDATNQKVKWKSSDLTVASVSEAGVIKAIYGGDCEITCTTEDGSYSATVKVHVPSFSFDQSEYTVTSKKGLTINLNWYCNDALTLQDNGGSYFDASWVDGEAKITIVPKRAGKGSIVVYNENVPKDRVTVPITIDHSAVYDTQSYPAIQYDSAMRYPDNWKGDKVSFSGKVQQVMQSGSTTIYRISSKGRYDNIVYVTINNSDILTPVIEDDMVTVYGSYNGNETYTSIWGQSITIPHVKAERIVVK